MTNLSRPILDSVGPIVSERQAARRRLTEWRTTLPESDYRNLNDRLVDHLYALLSKQTWGKGCVALYQPIRREPDLSVLYRPLQQLGFSLALPVVEAKHQPLVFCDWQPGQDLVADATGIAAPNLTAGAIRVIPRLLIIPCVGFSAQYLRLGYGGGYYDRTLALPANAGIRTIGVGFAACEIKSLAALQTDYPLHQIVTENGSL